MIIEQVSIFSENKPGKLKEVLTALANAKINIQALSVADTSDFGIVRIIASEPQKVREILKDAGFAVRLTPVVAVKVGDKPGELLKHVKMLSDFGINIEYSYAFFEFDSKECKVVLKVNDVYAADKLLNTIP